MADGARPDLGPVAALAAEIFGAEAALVAAFRDGCLDLLAQYGSAAKAVPEGLRLATLAVDPTGVLLGATAAEDLRLAGLDLRLGRAKVRLFAAAVFRVGERPAGVICALDRAARPVLPEEGVKLARLAMTAGSIAALQREITRLDGELSDQQASLRAARDSEQLLIDYLMTATDGVWQTDLDHRFVSTTTDLATIHLSPERVYGKTVFELAGVDPLRHPAWKALYEAFERRKPIRGFEYALTDDSGHTLWREVNGNPIIDREGVFRGFRGTSRDITARKLAEARMREMDSRLAALTDSGLVGIIVGQGPTILEANDEFLRILGYSQAEFAAAAPGWEQLVEHSPAGEAGQRAGPSFDAQGSYGPVEIEVKGREGRRAPVLLSAVLLDREAQRWMCLVQDISERKLAEARIRELADRDTLTGLLNRRSFMERFAEAVGWSKARNLTGALILLDLDHFKDVNDTLGHDAGDALLCEVAGRLQRSVRHADCVARLGGDEFAVLVSEVATAEELAPIARRMLEQLRRPFDYQGKILRASASAGLVLFPRDGDDPKQLLKHADIALYHSKSRGRQALNFFDAQMLIEYEDRLALEAELQSAFGEGAFVLAFQPIVRLSDGQHAGFEALLRWNHPSRGLLSPASFIATLEQSGLIVAVGRAILDLALGQMRAWLDAGLEPGHMAVNVAAGQLRNSDLVRDVEQLLKNHGLAPERLRIEITENTLIENGLEIGTTLEALHQLGVGIALDDFGTGFASLSHLKKVPVDVLKIDRCFVRDIGRDADDAAISRTIITLAHSLNMTVVAEGVASEEALEFLRINGCDEGQGYLFATPLRPEEASRHLQRGRPSLAPVLRPRLSVV